MMNVKKIAMIGLLASAPLCSAGLFGDWYLAGRNRLRKWTLGPSKQLWSKDLNDEYEKSNELDTKGFNQLLWRVNNANQIADHWNAFNWWIKEPWIKENALKSLNRVLSYLSFDPTGLNTKIFELEGVSPFSISSEQKKSFKEKLNTISQNKLDQCYKNAREGDFDAEKCDIAFGKINRAIYSVLYNKFEKNGDF